MPLWYLSFPYLINYFHTSFTKRVSRYLIGSILEVPILIDQSPGPRAFLHAQSRWGIKILCRTFVCLARARLIRDGCQRLSSHLSRFQTLEMTSFSARA
jgi:hypothetical protein